MKIKNSLTYLTAIFIVCFGLVYGMQLYQQIEKEKNQELINSIQNLKSNLYETNLQLDRMLFATDLIDANKKFEKQYDELRVGMEEIFNSALYKKFRKDSSNSIESDTSSLLNLFLMNDDKILILKEDINALGVKYYTYLPGLFTSSVYYQGDDQIQKTKDSVELLSENFSSQVSKQLEMIIETVRLETAKKEQFSSKVIMGVLLLSLAIVLLIAFLIIRPIRSAVKKFFDFALNENDLTKRISVNSRDELGDMAAFINKTFQHISQMIGAISREGVSMAAVGEDLSCNMNESVSAINQISANIEGIKKQICNQSGSITETQSILEMMLHSIEALNGLVVTQSANVEQSSASIEEMVSNTHSVTQILKKNNDSIAELINVAQQGKQQMGDVSSRIKEMAKNSVSLLEAGMVIQNVANQTNLLAMNAAIEAAHAGEAGKGFAVVAVEIRKLAEESNRQGKAITSTLSNLKKSIDEVNFTALESFKRMELSFTLTTVVQNQEIIIKNAMDEQNSASTEVLLAIQEINQITNQVRDTVVQMRTGSHDVQERMNNLVHISEEITDGMKEMSIGVEQITESVNQVSVMSVRNRESIGKLTAEVGKFKIENE